MLRKLPVDLSTFHIMRESNYLYVDKTRYAYDLITGGRRFFLSRPRRFGKSLFVSTLHEILRGNKKLFEGLWIGNSDYQWKEHGIINFDLSTLGIDNIESLKKGICFILDVTAKEYGFNIQIDDNYPEIALQKLVYELYKRFGHVAILIDEYDYPILRQLHNKEQACAIRDAMRSFFGVIKGLDAKLDFLFITGVSSFAKAGLFSGINNLRIISLQDKFAGICGYNDEEIDAYFSAHIQEWALNKNSTVEKLRAQIKEWYNGYRFSVNAASVYNPFSLMHALELQEFKNFWFQSGAPQFLVQEITKKYREHERAIFDPESIEISEDSLGIFDIGATPLPALMFQTGYLTIAEYLPAKNALKLGYPNFEVKTAFQKYMLSIFASIDLLDAEQFSSNLAYALNQEDIQNAVTLIKQLFVRIPYQLHIKEEKFYHALLQMAFAAGGLKAYSEYPTSHGRLDIVVEALNTIYVIEIKLNATAQAALDQIKQRKYYEALLFRGKSIILLGLAFKKEPKNFEISYVTEKVSQ